MEKILRKIEKFIPKKIYKIAQPFYHLFLALIGMIIYNFPAKKMIIIGITGTKGKTSTANFIHSVLNEKYKTGLISTANIKIGDEEKENKYHMSMPGRFILQKFLKKMQKEKCKFVVVEVTSEGIKQFRHLGLFLDISVFTNLSPEHLASHNNSFEKYRETKMRIFKKNIFNKLKYILINIDDENSEYFFNKEKNNNIKKIKFSMNEVSNIIEKDYGIDFSFEKENYHINILGKFNIYNSLPAIILGKIFDLNNNQIKNGLDKIKNISGRMEEIKDGQNFRIFIDYAHEKLSINNLLNTGRDLAKNNKIIIVLGGDGGGRDKQRLFDMGEAVGKKADYIIITNSDPYFDDELELANTIKNNALKENDFRQKNNLEKLEDNKNIFIILDRKEGIKKACELANDNDIVLLATRGSLNTMSIKGKKIPSNDKIFVKEILKEILK